MKAKDIPNKLIPFTPLIIIFAVILIKPYYLFPNAGDTDFHLAKAHDILLNPLLGLFWDNLTYYPLGRPVWHQPLIDTVYALMWGLGGVRFAHSFMCVLQLMLTVGVATWIANKEYGIFAGYFAGIFALLGPLQYTLIIAIPATYIPIFAMLTIYYLPKDKKKAFIMALLGLWTHMIALVSFLPLFFVDNYKDKRNLKIIALLLPSIIFWAGYWIYFSNRMITLGTFYSVTHLNTIFGTTEIIGSIYSFLLVYTLGSIGLYLLLKINKKQFELILTYVTTVIVFSFFGFQGDYLRGFQFATLPMAILSGLTVQKGYEYVSHNYKPIFSSILILMFLLLSMVGAVIFFAQLPNQQGKGWEALNYPFEGDYAPLKDYIEQNTGGNDVIWTESKLAEKIAWMTGRKISNGKYVGGEYGTIVGFEGQHQKINIYESQGIILVKNINNVTIKEFRINNAA
ncbi:MULTISPECIES: hypothetical protein [Methanobacterium]|uniref:Glycosyltransferase RgtA/B/C/D-like domain-containing protein n=1 Tax=Methanobacterium bryantii TaxID=2161 RepID=A0A2A2H4C6_METBR|nr:MULTISPECIES: hypothetical protein [Methanobacterium]OEC84689.1 hypothetical protein A9507_15030 [Methanobacterium sp. A39]PAV04281.1 hypothetical protein ASJ80_05375 [Methanobacterium bryantii]